jgi:hypothetical protein
MTSALHVSCSAYVAFWLTHRWVLHCRCPSLHSRGYLRNSGVGGDGVDAPAQNPDNFRGAHVGDRRHILQIQELTHENIMLLLWWATPLIRRVSCRAFHDPSGSSTATTCPCSPSAGGSLASSASPPALQQCQCCSRDRISRQLTCVSISVSQVRVDSICPRGRS